MNNQKNKNFLLLNNPKVILDQILLQINQAQVQVLVQFMSFESDIVGDQIADVLVKKAESGVEVCVMVDGFIDYNINDKPIWNFHYPHTWKTLLRDIPNTKLMYKRMRDSGIKFLKTNPIKLYNPVSLLRRDHRKMVIVDNKRALVGGFNATEHNYNWNDVAVSINDEKLVEILSKIFLRSIENKNIRNKKFFHEIMLKKFPKILFMKNKKWKMSHGKIALLDDRIIFGSSNFFHGLLTELEISIVDKNLAEQVYKRFVWLQEN